jgi:hypothetical protein
MQAGTQHGLGLAAHAAARHANLSESKNFGSGQKRSVVPVLALPTVPTFLELRGPLAARKPMLYSLPPRRIQHFEVLRQRVDHRHADTMQAAGEL